MTESLATAPAYAVESFLIRARDASSWGRAPSAYDQGTIAELTISVYGWRNAWALAEQRRKRMKIVSFAKSGEPGFVTSAKDFSSHDGRR